MLAMDAAMRHFDRRFLYSPSSCIYPDGIETRCGAALPDFLTVSLHSIMVVIWTPHPDASYSGLCCLRNHPKSSYRGKEEVIRRRRYSGHDTNGILGKVHDSVTGLSTIQ